MITEIRKLIIDENSRNPRGFINGEVDDFIEKFMAHADVFCHYTAGRCDAVIAFYCNDSSRNLAYVTLMLCAPESRGKKIGSSLLEAAISTAFSRGFKLMELEVDDDNHAAISMYSKHGFVQKYHENGRYKMTLSLNMAASP